MARKTVIDAFDNVRSAREAVGEIRRLGIPAERISLLANQQAAGTHNSEAVTDAEIGADVVADAGIGAALGSIGGLLLGLAAFAIPGIGPVVAAGPLFTTLSGAGLGAVAGGVVGALNEAGVPEEEAHRYKDDVRGGSVLVVVQTDDAAAERVREILDRHGVPETAGDLATPAIDEQEAIAENPPEWLVRTEPTHDYRDPSEPGGAPLSADEARRERKEYGDHPWPRPQAYDIGDTLTDAPIVQAAVDSEHTAQADRNIRRRAKIYESLSGR